MKLKNHFLWAALASLFFIGTGCAQNGAAQNDAVLFTVSPPEYSVPVTEGVTTKVIEDGKTLSVTSPGGEKSIIIDLGWIPVQPNMNYRARYFLKAAAIPEAASVYMLLRDHEEKGKAPIKPYHVVPTTRRAVPPAPNDQWIEQSLSFTTGANTHFLSGSIVILKMKGELHLSKWELLDAAKSPAPQAVSTPAAAVDDPAQRAVAKAEWEKAIAEIRAQAQQRAPLTPRPLVFSRSQMKYGLEKNYYHDWNDRPLLVNREYRGTDNYVTPLPSYKRTLEEVLKYDIDGLAFFPETKNRLEMIEAHQKAGVPGVGLLGEFVGAFTPDHVDAKTEILKKLLAAPSTPRINGKVLITSYGAESLKPEEWKAILDTLRERVGDKFIFLPSLTNVVSLRTTLMNGDYPSLAEIEKAKAFLRSYLDVTDGIYFNYPPALRNKDRTFDDDFYRNVFIPVFKSVLAEPKYKNKYLGLSAYRSHMSPERGNNLHEDGTRTLRTSFEAAMDARPDVIILPEWDEQNENTSFRPTVYGSRTSERILRYYMSRIKSKAPTPLPGDDGSTPNLILSTRKNIALGEKIMVELLNVPDSNEANSYRAQLSFVDENGKLVRQFDEVNFDATKLQEHRLYLSSETIPGVRALVPVLTIRGYKGRDQVFDSGFHAIQIRATWNWDHLYVKQPLREILRPASAELKWENPTTNGAPLTLVGSVSAPEELALVEVLGDDDEVYALDSKDEFFRDDPTKELFLVEYRSLNPLEMKGTLSLKNADAKWLTPETILHQQNPDIQIKGNTLSLSTPVSVHQRWVYLAIPKNEVANAKLDFDFDKAKFSVPLQDVVQQKMMARAFENGLHISVQPYHRQIEMPSPLNKKAASFRVQVWPEIATEQFHLRLTGKDGKLFRSRPLLLPGTNAPLQKLRVYSDTQNKGVDVQVAADRIPNLTYDFAPARGAVLLTDAGKPFWASLGGFVNTTTGRGTINSLHGDYPKQVVRSAPQWVTDENRPALEFDGAGTYLEMPREALPWRGAFTLSFEVKPATDKDQTLLINHAVTQQNGLWLGIKGGKLQASFRDADWKTNQFSTDLAVPSGVWSKIEVRYDFQNLTFSVNGKSQSFPQTLPAMNIGFPVFGEGWRGANWFEGRMRDLKIVQNAF
jgi:hypothetical protein